MHPSIRKCIQESPPEATEFDYPITAQELEDRRQHIQNKRVITAAGFLFAIAFAGLFAVFGFAFLLVPVVAFLYCVIKTICGLR